MTCSHDSNACERFYFLLSPHLLGGEKKAHEDDNATKGEKAKRWNCKSLRGASEWMSHRGPLSWTEHRPKPEIGNGTNNGAAIRSPVSRITRTLHTVGFLDLRGGCCRRSRLVAMGERRCLVRWIMHVSQGASTASAYGLAGSTRIALAHSVCKSRCVSSRVSLSRFASAAQASHVPNNAPSPRGCRGLSQHPMNLSCASQRGCLFTLSVLLSLLLLSLSSLIIIISHLGQLSHYM